MRNFKNLNVNPCKMCMPMGAMLAIKGIENAMPIIHGSQGCSTYIRRHMSGHFNEPVDIASTSINEKGTVYGGEENLVKGIANVIRVYDPDIIGIATTCLAETIGEDINRIVSEYKIKNDEKRHIITVSSPGYGGTEYEGYYLAVKNIISGITEKSEKNKKNNRVNVIVSMLSPEDIRNIKRLLTIYGIDYILIPDISQTLDAPITSNYKQIPEGGTKISDIEMMSGAKATIEIGITVPEKYSPGEYLNKTYNIPLYKCPIPIGIEYTDMFLDILSHITGKKKPNELEYERAMLLDAMVDAHKFNAEGNIIIYGEPELCVAINNLCRENGIKNPLICSGTKNPYIKEYIKKSLNDTIVLDDTDFETILDYTRRLEANMLVGSSEGKIATEKYGIPLVRVGFPINDRIGGQRIKITGYNGTVEFLDRITNTIIEMKYTNYRKKMYNSFFKEEKIKNKLERKDTKKHPCYNGSCHTARLHLPVAPKCNISCNYCNRKYDCVNESRPGVTSTILTPEEAFERFLKAKDILEDMTVVGIAGPGDALADFKKTRETINLIRAHSPEMIFCISTNGLLLPYYAHELIDMNINHLTVTVNAVDENIGARIYKYINYMGIKTTGKAAFNILSANQLAGIKIFSNLGGVVKVNIVNMKGVNDNHIVDVVRIVKEKGASITNIMPMIPAEGSVFENIELIDVKELSNVRKECQEIMPQMYHCKQCRADAAGKLGENKEGCFSKKVIEKIIL